MANQRKVAILGFGPTAVFVARAAFDAGCEVTIFGKDDKMGTPPGAFWLHWVPDTIQAPLEPEKIIIHSSGKEEWYTQRQWMHAAPKFVWGELSSSFPEAPVAEFGYSPAATLSTILPPYKMQYTTSMLDREAIQQIAPQFDATFQTFPEKAHFEYQPQLLPFVAAAAPVSMLGPVYNEDNMGNRVYYNGTPQMEDVLVREAILFGMHYLEFGKGCSIDYVHQPLRAERIDISKYQWVTLKDLHPHSIPMEHDMKTVHLVGRMAMWDRKFLSHDAYEFTRAVLDA